MVEIIRETDFQKARNKIREAKKLGKIVVFTSSDDEMSRKVCEKEKIDVLLIYQSGRKDFMKQRNSGLNHVMTKICKDNKIAVGISLDEITESNKWERLKIFSRIRQNIELCNKDKVHMVFIAEKEQNKRNSYDLKALGLSLGMPTWMMK